LLLQRQKLAFVSIVITKKTKDAQQLCF
jgi:hypothetical protein